MTTHSDTHADPWMPTHLDWPTHSLYDRLRAAAERWPHHIILSDESESWAWTFRELIAWIDDVAQALADDGVRPGDVVTLALPTTATAVVVFYATNAIGAIASLLHPKTPPAIIAQRLCATGSTTLIATHDTLHHLVAECLVDTSCRLIESVPFVDFTQPTDTTAHDPGVTPFSVWRCRHPRAIRTTRHTVDPMAPAVYLHSGGTTGDPKTVMLSAFSFNALAVQAPYLLRDRDLPFDPLTHVHLAVLPLFHGFGLGIGIHFMMTAGVRVILVASFSPERLITLMAHHQPTILAGVPTMFVCLFTDDLPKTLNLKALRHIFCGGDSLSADARQAIERCLRAHSAPPSLRLREGYGLTEAVTVATVAPLTDNRPMTVGRPLVGLAVKIVDPDTGVALPDKTTGEICLSGPTLMIGYLNDPETTARVLEVDDEGHRWVHTGDAGRIEDGHLVFSERLKRMIKVSGVPVFPAVIEAVTRRVQGVHDVVAVAEPDDTAIHVVALFVIKDHKADSARVTEAIKEALGRDVGRHAVPRTIRYVESFPMTAIGKIDIKRLEAARVTPSPEAPHAKP